MARPSHASGTGTLPVTAPVARSITLMDGGLYPQLSTSMYLPSGVTTLDIGSVSSAICLPTGCRRQPLLSRNPPVASGPTCSRGAVCELKSAPKENRTTASAMRLLRELAEGFIDAYNCIPGECGPRLQRCEGT